MTYRLIPALVFTATFFSAARASAGEETVDYLRDVKPILAEKCNSCHGVLKQEGSLRLETRSLMVQGGDSGAAIAPGNPDESFLLERIVSKEMPPAEEGAPLKPEQIAVIRKWIEQGAAAPDEPIPTGPRDHWSFQRIERPPIPNLKSGTLDNPIDAFLEAKRQEHGLKQQPEVERSLAIRRLYLDLTGLPPTLEQLRDQRPWEEIVDELLASPHHGERWGRHWMDVWRYSDWYGLGAQLRNSQKHIWRWRDWIVESLNEDKGYDRMILEMLAGDEIAPNDPNVLRATGYLARNYFLFNRTTWLDSTIEHTGKAFLGLTLNCAKCHDHKYDPISAVDYYRMRAIFEPHQVRLDPIPGVTDFEKDGLPRVFDDHLDAVTYLHRRGDPKNPDTETEITPGVPELFADFAPPIEPVELPVEAYAPGVREYVQQDHLQQAKSKVEAAQRELAAAEKKLAEQIAAADKSSSATPGEPFLVEDDFDQPAAEVWEVVGDGWKYEGGAVHQTKPTREPQWLRLKKPHPNDFDLTCRYTTTGGTTYKSVTFRFDHSDEAKYDNCIYTSAHEPAPKVQAAYTRNGANAYPAEGVARRPIKVGETYTLRVAVRDRLANVWLNDQFVLAYRFPDRRPGGHLTLSGFDATVAFDWIKIESLSEKVALKEANGAAPVDPTAAVRLASAKLKSAQAELAALQAIVAADDARYMAQVDASEADRLAKEAAVRQAEAVKAAAEFQVLASGTDEAKRKNVQAALEEAEKKLAAAKNGETSYTSLRGAKKALESPADKEEDYPPVFSKQSTGRRLALAKWIVSRDNPLTARVAVNHVWMRHFGEPLVESVFDFGLRTKKPEHAELLDYLAAEFMESGWSFKRLHRLMVTSRAYRLESSTANADPGTLAADATNRFYWRMNTRRMESQIVRDSLLSLAGSLDPKLGGPSLDPTDKVLRRGLYFKHSRDDQDKFLSMFDDADLMQCYRRSESIVPQQALALSNSLLSIQMANKIADRLSADHPGDGQAFIAVAFETLLGRAPDAEEVDACRDFVEKMKTLAAATNPDAAARIRGRLVHALINHNDFVSIR